MPRAVIARLFAFAALLVTLSTATLARAHQAGISQGRYELRGAVVAARLVFAKSELLPDARAIAQKLRIDGDGRACTTAFRGSSETSGDGLELAIDATCDGRPHTLRIHAGFLELLPAGHRHLMTISTDEQHETTAVAVLSQMDVETTADAHASSFFALFRLGIEHILTGYDHLVFLFGLVLAGGRARSLAFALTAFTLAHSISLALAVLGVWAPAPAIVEPAIALSIAYVGVENLWRARRDPRNDNPARGRWAITFPFGLVHGFGFAGALAEIGLPRPQIPGALVAFNLGVEAGQLAVLVAILPLLGLARRSRAVRGPATAVANVGIVLAGAVWFTLRVRGV